MDVITFGSSVQVERVTLPVKEPKEIFSSVIIEKNEKTQLKDLTKELSSLIDQLYSSNDNQTSIYDILDNSVLDSRIKDLIVQYLEQYGIYRK